MRDPIPVTVLTGYLGSGKTTLVNRLLADPQGLRMAVIVNDLGEVNIDASLIAQKGHASFADDSLVALSNGCICCTLQMDLVDQITRLAGSGHFDYILIEASGICEPKPIAQSIVMLDSSLKKYGIPSICRLDAIVTVVDAYRLLTEFAGGEALIHPEEADISQLVVEQIEFCNLVLLNKTDLLSEEETARIEAIIKALQPSARIVRTHFADVPSKEILNIGLFDFTSTFLSAGWAQSLERENRLGPEQYHADEERHHEAHMGHSGEDSSHGGITHGDEHSHEEDPHEDHSHGDHFHDDEHPDEDHSHEGHSHEEHSHMEEYGVSTFVYYRRQPFDGNKLAEWLDRFPASVVRSKGLVWIAENDATCFLLDQAGKAVNLQPFSRWLATASPQEREETWKRDPASRKNWDERYGDRMNRLVFIGIGMVENEICESLDQCLA